jgi:hypothetical protein
MVSPLRAFNVIKFVIRRFSDEGQRHSDASPIAI